MYSLVILPPSRGCVSGYINVIPSEIPLVMVIFDRGYSGGHTIFAKPELRLNPSNVKTNYF